MMIERAEFRDDAGRRWEVQVLWAHPALPERGIFGARYTCLDDESEAVRVGYIQRWALEGADEELMLEMLREAEPGTPIG
jgi:hypothetical protein